MRRRRRRTVGVDSFFNVGFLNPRDTYQSEEEEEEQKVEGVEEEQEQGAG